MSVHLQYVCPYFCGCQVGAAYGEGMSPSPSFSLSVPRLQSWRTLNVSKHWPGTDIQGSV